MKRGRGNYGALSVLPVVLCMVMVFCLGVWYEREYGLQKEHTGRLMYTATVAAHKQPLQDFKPMFAVNVQTGQITLNRMKEALGYDYSSR